MTTNEWTYEELSLKAQINQKKPKRIGEKTCTTEANNLKEDVIIVGNMTTKRQTVGNFMGNPNTESIQEEKI